MTQFGAVTCNKFVAQGVLFGTYYDGLDSMELIRAYRAAKGAGAPELANWNACSDVANSVYRSYVLTNNGSVPGYNVFTDGLRKHFLRTADNDSYKAVAYMAGYQVIDTIGHGAAYCSLDYNQTWVGLQRESAYCLRAVLDTAGAGGPAQTSKRDLLEANIKTQIAGRIGTRAAPTPLQLPHPEVANGYCPPAAPVGKNMYVQPFMLNIEARILIQYYEEVGLDQANILETVRWIGDWLMAEAYVPADKAFWYENCRVSGGATWAAKPGAVDLSLMFVQTFEWLYRKTCDPTYRDFADTLFDEAVRLGPGFLGFDGKHFNQNYAQGSFDYVAMRQITSPRCP